MEFKILSLDGGGSWALIQARVLAERYGTEITGHEVLRKYDMVIANSGGSLVLAMLCANHKLSRIIKTFRDTDILKEIFKPKINHYLPTVKKFTPNYQTKNKFETFKLHLTNDDVEYGKKLLSELPSLINPQRELQIVITCFDYDRRKRFISAPKKIVKWIAVIFRM